MDQSRTLGTALRHLLTLLDGDLDSIYADDGFGYRPRYTPIVRALSGPTNPSLRQIAQQIGISHSAVSQTVTKMKQDGWVMTEPSEDAREVLVTAAPKLTHLLPLLERRWSATNTAADRLNTELSASLSAIVDEAIAALERRPFRLRIEEVVNREI